MLLALLSTLGCYKIDYVTNSPVTGNATTDYWNHRVIWGIIELEGPLQLEDVCPNGQFDKVHTEQDIISGLISYFFTGAIYTPNTVSVWCSDGTAYRGGADSSGAVVYLEAPLGQEVPLELGVSAESCSELEFGGAQ